MKYINKFKNKFLTKGLPFISERVTKIPVGILPSKVTGSIHNIIVNNEILYQVNVDFYYYVPTGLSYIKLNSPSQIEVEEILLHGLRKYGYNYQTGFHLEENKTPVKHVLSTPIIVNGEEIMFTRVFISMKPFFVVGNSSQHIVFSERWHIGLYESSIVTEAAYAVLDYYDFIKDDLVRNKNNIFSDTIFICNYLSENCILYSEVELNRDRLIGLTIIPKYKKFTNKRDFSLTLGNQDTNINIFKKLKMKTAAHQIIPLNALKQHINITKQDEWVQGYLHYHVDTDNNTKLITKYDTHWYTIIKTIKHVTLYKSHISIEKRIQDIVDAVKEKKPDQFQKHWKLQKWFNYTKYNEINSENFMVQWYRFNREYIYKLSADIAMLTQQKIDTIYNISI